MGNIKQTNFISVFNNLSKQFSQSKRFLAGLFAALLMLSAVSQVSAQTMFDATFQQNFNENVYAPATQPDDKVSVGEDFKAFGGQLSNNIARSAFAQLLSCTPTSISYGQTVFGEINTSDCLVNDKYADEYTFSGVAGQQVNIKFRTYQFTSLLELLDSNGTVLASSNSANILNEKQITHTLISTGTYTIRSSVLGQHFRHQNITGGNYYLSIAQNSAACSYNMPVSGTGRTSIVQTVPQEIVTTQGCSWNAFTEDSWITISGASSGNGNGTVNFVVSANDTGAPRRGNVTVGGLTAYVYQWSSLPCSTTPIGYGQTINGDFSNSDCTRGFAQYSDIYTFSGNAGDQIAVSTSAGSLSSGSVGLFLSPSFVFGNIQLPLQGYYTLPVTGTYEISASANASFDSPNNTGTYTISLTGIACTYSLSASSIIAPISGSQNNTVGVVASSNICPWMAVSNDSWITVTSGGSNVTGSGTATFNVAPNNGTARTGTLTIGGQTYTVTQTGAVQPGTAVPINANATYLRTNEDPQSVNAIPIDLNALGIFPGDIVELKELGGYAYYSGCSTCQPPISSDPENATAITAVFSSTTALLSSSQLNRVSGAIPANSFPVFTPDTKLGALMTNISQDFNISTGNIYSVNIIVPQNARYLFVSAGDTFFGDNGDSDNDFALQITKIPAPQNCTYSLSSTAVTIPVGGLSNQQFNLLTQAGCPYLAVSDQPWLTVLSSGLGSGIIRYSASENTGASTRSGTISVGGQTFTVNQQTSANCSINQSAFRAIGYGQNITGFLSNDSCQANSLFSDLSTFSGQAGDRIAITLDAGFSPKLELINAQGSVIQTINGSNSIQNVRLPAAPGYFTLPATGTYTLRVSGNSQGTGDYSLSLYVAPPPTAAPCTYSLSSPQTNATSGGGKFFVDVLTQDGCPPLAAPGFFGQIYDVTSYLGGRIAFLVRPNTSATDRQETIAVSGLTHTVFQYGGVPPVNDAFSTAAQLSGINTPAGSPTTGDSTNATAETSSEPAHNGTSAAKSVWYKWTTPNEDGLYSFSTSGSSFDTVMAIYACPAIGSCSLTSLTAVGSNDDTTSFDKTSKVNFRATANMTYYIAVDGKNGAGGAVQLSFQQYERLFRLYLQTFNGDQSPLTPDRVSATNGSRTFEAAKISQGVYEFNLPSDKTVYIANISGPTGIVWTVNNFPLGDSPSQQNRPTDGESSGEITVSNAQNATPRFFIGFIKNIAGQELDLLSVKISYSRGANPVAPNNCKVNQEVIAFGGTSYAEYQCVIQPNTLNDIIPSREGKSFATSVISFPAPVSGDGGELFPRAQIVASNAPTFNISGHVSAGGAGTKVDLTYLPTGNNETITVPTTTIDASGFYEFKNLPPGTYTLKATRAGFVFAQPESVTLQTTGATVDIGVQQACTYEPAQALSPLSASAGAGSLMIRTNNPTCAWTATSQVSWIQIISGSTVGNGQIHFKADANSGAARSGVIRVGGQDISVTQSAAKARKRVRLF